MKVLLLKNVKKLGTAGQLVEVSSGFAANKLIPSGLAKIATVSEESNARNADVNKAKDTAQFIEWAKMAIVKLEGTKLSFTAKSSEKGHLFGSISEKEIAEQITKDLSLEVSAHQVLMEKHIKELGDTAVSVILSPEYTAKVIVTVFAE